MPATLKIRIVAARGLPVMDRTSGLTDAFVEARFGSSFSFSTAIARKTLDPVWRQDARFNVADDSELQNEPLVFRVFDHDVYSADDLIGTVYIPLGPLLQMAEDGSNRKAEALASRTMVKRSLSVPPERPFEGAELAPTISEPLGAAGGAHGSEWTGSGAMGGDAQGQQGEETFEEDELEGWFPIYDTLNGIRGELKVVVKATFYGDENPFKESSAGVRFFAASVLEPATLAIRKVFGFVEELVVETDPEYEWSDNFRTARKSNESRQGLLYKLSNQVRRQIGKKVLELGGNAVIGYEQTFDIEGDSGLVARAAGTACIVQAASGPKKEDAVILPAAIGNLNTSETIPAKPLTNVMPDGFEAVERFENLHFPSQAYIYRGIKLLAPTPAPQLESYLERSASMKEDDLRRVHEDSDEEDSNAGVEVVNEVVDETEQKLKSVTEPPLLPDLEFDDSVNSPSFLQKLPGLETEVLLLTINNLPVNLHVRLGGIVASRSVKYLGRLAAKIADQETRDQWWAEIREEIRSHAKSLRCQHVLGYREECEIYDDVCILHATGTAATILKDRPIWSIATVEKQETDGEQSEETSDGDEGEEEMFVVELAVPGMTNFSYFQQLEEAQRDWGLHPRNSSSTSGKRRYRGRRRSDRTPSSPRLSPGGGSSRKLRKSSLGSSEEILSPIGSPILLSRIGSDEIIRPQWTEGGSGVATTAEMESLKQERNLRPVLPCAIAHVPYNHDAAPFANMRLVPCGLCRKRWVPEVMMATIEPPPLLPITGAGAFVEARVCRSRPKLSSKSESREADASAVSENLVFLEIELHRQLMLKLKIMGMNAAFALRTQVHIGPSLIVGITTATAVHCPALPPPAVLRINRNIEVEDQEDEESLEMQQQVEFVAAVNRERLFTMASAQSNAYQRAVKEAKAQLKKAKRQAHEAWLKSQFRAAEKKRQKRNRKSKRSYQRRKHAKKKMKKVAKKAEKDVEAALESEENGENEVVVDDDDEEEEGDQEKERVSQGFSGRLLRFARRRQNAEDSGGSSSLAPPPASTPTPGLSDEETGLESESAGSILHDSVQTPEPSHQQQPSVWQRFKNLNLPTPAVRSGPNKGSSPGLKVGAIGVAGKGNARERVHSDSKIVRVSSAREEPNHEIVAKKVKKRSLFQNKEKYQASSEAAMTENVSLTSEGQMKSSASTLSMPEGRRERVKRNLMAKLQRRSSIGAPSKEGGLASRLKQSKLRDEDYRGDDEADEAPAEERKEAFASQKAGSPVHAKWRTQKGVISFRRRKGMAKSGNLQNVEDESPSTGNREMQKSLVESSGSSSSSSASSSSASSSSKTGSASSKNSSYSSTSPDVEDPGLKGNLVGTEWSSSSSSEEDLDDDEDGGFVHASQAKAFTQKKRTFVVEVDDETDEDVIAVILERQPPAGIQFCNTEVLPGTKRNADSKVRDEQMVTMIVRKRLDATRQTRLNTQFADLFHELHGMLAVKIMTFVPCIVCGIRSKVSIPSESIVEVLFTANIQKLEPEENFAVLPSIQSMVPPTIDNTILETLQAQIKLLQVNKRPPRSPEIEPINVRKRESYFDALREEIIAFGSRNEQAEGLGTEEEEGLGKLKSSAPPSADLELLSSAPHVVERKRNPSSKSRFHLPTLKRLYMPSLPSLPFRRNSSVGQPMQPVLGSEAASLSSSPGSQSTSMREMFAEATPATAPTLSPSPEALEVLKLGSPTFSERAWRPEVQFSPLSFIPNHTVVRYLGRINLHFIRESWAVREGGGLGQFFHLFLSEAKAIARAHVAALRGNSILNFQITPRESTGKALKSVYNMISLSGDVAVVQKTT